MKNISDVINEKELLSYCQLLPLLNFKSRKKAKNLLSGQRNTKLNGRGLDYQESRIYNPGDDIRSMDWKLSARMNKPHIKLFEEAKGRPTYFVMDTNSSMFFATKSQLKISLQAKLVCSLATSSIKHGDSIGCMSFGASGVEILKPSLGQRALFKMIKHIVSNSQKAWEIRNNALPATSISNALHQLSKVTKSGGLIILFSDLYQLDETSKKQLALLMRHHEVVVFYLCDPFEVLPVQPGKYGLNNCQNLKANHFYEEAILNTNDAKVARALEAFQREQRQKIETEILHLGIPVLPFQTDWSIEKKLSQHVQYPQMAYPKWLQSLSIA